MGDAVRMCMSRSMHSGSPRRDNAEEVARRRSAMQREQEQRREEVRRLHEEKMARAAAQKEERLQKQRELQQREALRMQAAQKRRSAALAEEKMKKAAAMAKVEQAASRAQAQQKSRPVYAFGSSTPRELGYLTQLSKQQQVYDRKLQPASGGVSSPALNSNRRLWSARLPMTSTPIGPDATPPPISDKERNEEATANKHDVVEHVPFEEAVVATSVRKAVPNEEHESEAEHEDKHPEPVFSPVEEDQPSETGLSDQMERLCLGSIEEPERNERSKYEEAQREREERKARLAAIMSRTRGAPTAVVNPTTQNVAKESTGSVPDRSLESPAPSSSRAAASEKGSECVEEILSKIGQIPNMDWDRRPANLRREISKSRLAEMLTATAGLPYEQQLALINRVVTEE